ncbi:MAG: UDP-galactopyranose mutase, partial [Phycisphaerales bacterium]|nr:UDP-galactopyranose mutase [Phycisphaerales bacterium]
PYLEQHAVYSRGRFGMWKYEVANTDHSLMQGVELVNRLILGEPEQTIGIKYESTTDGRQAAVHERSVLAGSGDPKKAAERAAAGSTATSGAAATAATGLSAASDAVKAVVAAASKALSVAKTDPDAVSAARKQRGSAGGPGDKDEVHVSEEELGVTTTPDARRTSPGAQ